ncbi:Hypothetical predicted protein [Octopus vulgaris]|uniref:Uncharacterized protein n=1 Tax=Octopus vulgaris TaxID=6645 RepID=A0AA36B6G8_OCTVU|nr:Hypothetical predicted protein [Octopus vulgaris]
MKENTTTPLRSAVITFHVVNVLLLRLLFLLMVIVMLMLVQKLCVLFKSLLAIRHKRAMQKRGVEFPSTQYHDFVCFSFDTVDAMNYNLLLVLAVDITAFAVDNITAVANITEAAVADDIDRVVADVALIVVVDVIAGAIDHIIVVIFKYC